MALVSFLWTHATWAKCLHDTISWILTASIDSDDCHFTHPPGNRGSEMSGPAYSFLDLQFIVTQLVLIWCGAFFIRWGPWAQGEPQGHIINLLLRRLFFKKNFCGTILILKMEEKNIFDILCFIISRKVKMQLKCKKKKWERETDKRFVQCMEKQLWLSECIKSGFWSFTLKILTGRCSMAG